MTASLSNIKFSKDRSLAFVELDRPAALNALNTEMLKSIGDRALEWAKDPEVKCLFFHSSLPKAFCAGGDVKQLILRKHELAGDPRDGIDFFVQEYFTDCFVHEIKKPVVAWLEGITMGGGVGLTNGATLRIATDTSTFAMPEVYIGFFPDVGGSRFLSELKDNSGLYMGLSGDRVDARAALAMGLVDIILKDSDKNTVIELLKTFRFWNDKTKDRTHLIETLQAKLEVVVQHSADPADLQSRLEILKSPFAEKWRLLSADFNSMNFVRMRNAIKKVDNQRRRAILSQALAFQLIQNDRGTGGGWRDVFATEWELAIHLLKGSNFAEGVRAVLIDKDHKPDWPALTEEEALHEAQQILNMRIPNLLTEKFANTI